MGVGLCVDRVLVSSGNLYALSWSEVASRNEKTFGWRARIVSVANLSNVEMVCPGMCAIQKVSCFVDGGTTGIVGSRYGYCGSAAILP